MRNKVIAAGHICLDITPAIPERAGLALEAILAPGRLTQVGQASVHTGGAVANTGLAMRTFGLDVSLMGKIGDDALGGLVRGLLRRYGAADGLIVDQNATTSYSVVLAVPGVDRVFLHHSGANDAFSAADIPDAVLREAALLHFGYPPLMRGMYADTGAELVRLLRRAKDCGVATALDMAAVDSASEAGQADWREILARALPYVDFFLPSVEELCFMLDRQRLHTWQERAAGGEVTEALGVYADVRPLADQCMALGAKVLLIKCGAPGLYYRTAAQERLSTSPLLHGRDEWADREGFEQSYLPDRVLSGTGAGDTAIAAFLSAVLLGRPFARCVQLAAAAGAACVAAYDAVSGLPSLPELERRIDDGWPKRGGYTYKF
jgi:sugar/nucleoside kinase (ribokinase family)